MGYDLGGAVALKLALDRPELVERLVFADGARPGGLERARRQGEQLEALIPY